MGVFAYFDDSGKEGDRDVICLGCVAGFQERFEGFDIRWNQLLRTNGIKVLSAKDVLNYSKPISEKNDRVGLKNRIEDLMPFVLSIRKELNLISGTVVDVKEFKTIPSNLKGFVGNAALNMAFLRSVLHTLTFCPEGDVACLTFDEDNETTEPFYKMYKRVKRLLPEADAKLAAITFADDSSLRALQAADVVGSLVRLHYESIWNRKQFDYSELFEALVRPRQDGEWIWDIRVPRADQDNLKNLLNSLKEEWEKLHGKS
jgi:hypothetical protein